MTRNMEADSSVSKRLLKAWNTAKLWLILIASLVGTVASLSLPISQNQSAYTLEVNDVVGQDIPAPYALSYTSEYLTQQAREAAAEAVPNLYDPPDKQITRQQIVYLNAALDFIDAIRADEYASTEQKIEDLTSMQDLVLEEETAEVILEMQSPRWQAIKMEAVSVLEQVMRTEIRPDHLEEAQRTLPAMVGISLPEEEAALVVALNTPFVVPNARFNQEATEAYKQEARDAVAPVVKSYAEGELIAARGRVATEAQIEALREYGLLKPPSLWQDIATLTLLTTLLGAIFALFVYRAQIVALQNFRLATYFAVLFVVSSLIMQIMIPGRTVLPYLFPAAMLPTLMAIMAGPGTGALTAVISGALAGYLAPRGFEFGLYVCLSGIFGAFLVGKAERLASFFWSGIGASLAAVAVVVVFRFPDPATDALGKASLMAAALIMGLLSASLTFVMLLMIGNLLRITTNLQLIELSRPDHPLLQMLLRNAPGSYQHSLQVANLAEQAARSIGANALLTRVGALYHDIGKALRPQFFIENQRPGQNIHEQLDPATSADIILSHVQDGLKLARKHRIPELIRAFIPEHHGTMITSYQYRSALEACNGDTSQVDIQAYSYPGPRPQSRETALLMLADGVEAKARADSPQNEEEIDQLVQWIIKDRLSKGQLDQTDLTLKDLDTIRSSFVNTLKGIYHPRIPYPQAPQDQNVDQGIPTVSAPTTPKRA